MSNGIYAETSKTNSLEPKNGSDGIGKKPEVGDVWSNGKFKMFISSITERLDAVDVVLETGLARHITDKEKFTLDNFYLGKAKANINDLFEVQDEFK